MGAGFGDLAILEYQDLVRVAHGRKAVGDHETGSALHKIQQRLLKCTFGASVDRAGGFVEHQQRRVRQCGSGNGQQLTLAEGQIVSAFGHDGVVAVGERPNEVVGIGQPGCIFDFGIGGIEAAKLDVVAHGVGEQIGTLQHDAQLTAQRVFGDVADVVAIDGDTAGTDVVEAIQHIDNR